MEARRITFLQRPTREQCGRIELLSRISLEVRKLAGTLRPLVADALPRWLSLWQRDEIPVQAGDLPEGVEIHVYRPPWPGLRTRGTYSADEVHAIRIVCLGTIHDGMSPHDAPLLPSVEALPADLDAEVLRTRLESLWQSLQTDIDAFPGDEIERALLDVQELLKHGPNGTLPRPDGRSKEVPWNPDDPAYIASSGALKLIDKKITLPTLSKQLTPDGPMRYMRKGQRSRVHLKDFEAWWGSRKTDDAPDFWIGVGERTALERIRKQQSQGK